MALTNTPELGTLLRRQREDAGLSLRRLEELTGIHYRTLHKLEQGEGLLNDVRLQKIARTLGTTVEEYYAAAGFTPGRDLPEMTRYLRAKYHMPEDAVRELDQHFADIRRRYGLTNREEETE